MHLILLIVINMIIKKSNNNNNPIDYFQKSKIKFSPKEKEHIKSIDLTLIKLLMLLMKVQLSYYLTKTEKLRKLKLDK